MLAPCPFPTGQGTQVVIAHLASELVRQGHDVHLVTYGYGDRGRATNFPFHLHRGSSIQAGVRSGPSLLKPAADIGVLLAATRLARAQRFDMIHAHNVEGLALGILLKLKTGLPLVYHSHNAMGVELPTYFRSRWARRLAAWAGRLIDHTLPRAADAIIAFDSEHKALHQQYGARAQRVFVIPPGLDGRDLGDPPPAVRQRLHRELGPGPLLLYAGNPDGYQNLPLLWAAMDIVRQRLPAARLVVATHHPPALFQPEVDNAGLGDCVQIYQYRDHAELQALFAIAQVGVCPRTLRPGVPIKVLNYLDAGLQVVACRAGVQPFLASSCATLVDDTPAAFADGIVAALGETEGEERRREAKEAFEPFRIARHGVLYAQVYGAARASRRPWRSPHRPA